MGGTSVQHERCKELSFTTFDVYDVVCVLPFSVIHNLVVHSGSSGFKHAG